MYIEEKEQPYMIEFKVQLEESLVEAFGHTEVERYLQEMAHQALLKFAANGVIADQQTIDLENDEEWKMARELAWQQESHKYVGLA
ncbi:MAG: hypothetical protein NWR72_01110 [Bacteroidia bacterium]|nr:hypothetical protein [Bacteroidia bacterium]